MSGIKNIGRLYWKGRHVVFTIVFSAGQSLREAGAGDVAAGEGELTAALDNLKKQVFKRQFLDNFDVFIFDAKEWHTCSEREIKWKVELRHDEEQINIWRR